MATDCSVNLDFWRTVPLEQMTQEQWESLCDGCGKCCLFKVEDEDTTEVFYTNVVCRLLDMETCRCTQYAQRSQRVPDCVTLTMEALSDPYWLPATCAYRLLSEGKELPEWHPLASADPTTVTTSGNSIYGRVVTETEVDDLDHHLIDWAS